MAVVIRLQGLPIVAGTMDIRHFFSGLTIPDGGVHIVGGELDGRVRVPGGAVRVLPEPPRQGPGLQVGPLCVLLQDAGGGRWAELDCTEKIKNSQDPEFGKKLVVDYYFEKVQKLKFSVHDIDNKSFDLNDDDFLGGIECTLGKVQCADRDSDGSHDLIGTLEMTLVKMQTSGAGSLVDYESIHLEKKQKKNNYKNSGIIMIKSARLKPSYFNEEPVSNQQYFILLIITDGEITDLDQTRQVIVNASKLPMSIIIIGVGEANFKAMEFLDGDSSVLKSVTGSSGSTFPDGLAEVPKQLVSYYKWQGCPPQTARNQGDVDSG